MDNNELMKIQKRLLEMGKTIRTILEKHEIPYCLAYGTLLGAIRHKGFIPWDDDFDFWLFDDTYDKALQALSSELPQDMFLEYFDSEPNYFHSWAHVKDVFSQAECKEYPQDSSYFHKGISIDLYRLKKVQLKSLWEYLKKEDLDYIERRRKNYLMSNEDYMVRLERNAKMYKENPSFFGSQERYVFALVSPYKCKFLEADDVLPVKQVCFENECFNIPCNSESVLSKIYGNYMTLPPQEKRVSHYSKVVFYDKKI